MIDMHQLHAGGVDTIVTVDRKELLGAISRLVGCKEHHGTHVFVVDQSTGDPVRIGVSQHGAACLNDYFNPPPPSWEDQLRDHAKTGSGWVNGHELRAIMRTEPEECWRISHLADIRARIQDDPEKAAKWDGYTSTDFPNGLIHDETCDFCKGTGVTDKRVVDRYVCHECETEGHYEDFYVSCCIADHWIGDNGTWAANAAIVREWREVHDEDHTEKKVRGCPRCIEERMLRAYEERKQA